MNEMVIYPYPYPCKTCLNLCFIRQAIRPNWKLLGFSIGPYGNAESTHYMLIWSSIISCLVELSWAWCIVSEISLEYFGLPPGRVRWQHGQPVTTPFSPSTVKITFDYKLQCLNEKKSFDSKMSLMVMEWLLIVQSHNHTDPHSQVLFPVVNEDT